jgi:hypothetical protein
MRTIVLTAAVFLGIAGGEATAKKAEKAKPKSPSSFWCGTLTQNGHEVRSLCFDKLDQAGCGKVLGYFADQYQWDRGPCWQQGVAYFYRSNVLGLLGAKADDKPHYFPTEKSCEDARAADLLCDPQCRKSGE